MAFIDAVPAEKPCDQILLRSAARQNQFRSFPLEEGKPLFSPHHCTWAVLAMDHFSEFRSMPKPGSEFFRSRMIRILAFALFALRPGAVAGSSSAHDAVPQPLSRRWDVVPTTEKFLWRAYHTTVVLGNYLYIEGGMFGQLVNGTYDSVLKRMNPSTLYIDMSSDWTNSSVKINEIYKDESVPKFSWPRVWAKDDNSFFLWSGQDGLDEGPNEVGNYTNALWKFSANSTGGGFWVCNEYADSLNSC
ncbi:hypothetical protein IWZ01DRAFT_7118 [Phyllosticta capitalensis]